MIKKLNLIETFENMALTNVIGIKFKSDTENFIASNQAFDKYLILKNQRARVWVGLIKVNNPLTLESILKNTKNGDAFRKAY